MALAAGALLAGIILVWRQDQPGAITKLESKTAYPHKQFYRSLDGLGVDTAEAARSRVVGVAIDNHPDARPQLGLSQAAVVYEAPVEGNLTRFLALYPASSTVESVGPVRSARPYFIDWLAEYGNALYLHSGGSPEALRFLKSTRAVFDINEFSWGEYFWRDARFTPPHNLFTSSSRWQEILSAYGERRPERSSEGWQFATNTPASLPATTSVRAVSALAIPYAPDYRVEWRWNASHQRWEREVNGVGARDAGGEALAADNVIIQYVSARAVDEEGRLELTAQGEGEARFLQRGQLGSGTWRKNEATARTRFYHPDGSELTLVPGITWVQVVAAGTTLEISN